MKIVLIHAKINYDNMEPFGLLSLGTVLKEMGHEVLVLDFFPGDIDIQLRRIDDFKPQLIGYGIETPSFARISRIHEILKEKFPNVIYCSGGPHTTALPEETLRQLSLDFIVTGESERSFPKIVAALESKEQLSSCAGIGYLDNERFISNDPPSHIKNLDTLPIVDRTLLADYAFYLQPPGNIRGLVIPGTANVMTSRGCFSGCIFCESALTHGKELRQRSVSHVIEEIAQLKKKYTIQALFFIDDIFTHNKEWVLDFCKAMQDYFPELQWGCQSRADCLDEELIQAMKNAGCLQVDIGVESGDPKVLKKLGKGEKVSDFITVANLLHKYNIRLLCSFITGSPAEDWHSIEMTKRLIHTIKPSMCQYFTLVPYPGTALGKLAEKNQWYEKFTYSEQYSQKTGDKGILFCGLSPDEQVVAKKKLQRATFIRDYGRLITGWLKYPRFLYFFLLVFIKNKFFIGTLIKAIPTMNVVSILQEVYAEFNKFLLNRVRVSNS